MMPKGKKALKKNKKEKRETEKEGKWCG